MANKFVVYAAKISLALGLLAGLYGCAPNPRDSPQCSAAPAFEDATQFTLKEHVLQLSPTYDIITGDNCGAGTMQRYLITFTRRTDINVDGKYDGRIESKFLSFGHNMDVYDADGNAIAAIDQEVISSVLNFGGFVLDIKMPNGSVVGQVKQDPFSLFDAGKWRYFEVKDPADGHVVATITQDSILPDTYTIANKSDINNEVLAGLTGIIDQIYGEQSSSSHSSK